VAINKSYYFIVGKDAMGCKIKKRKADPPFSKAFPSFFFSSSFLLIFFFFFFCCRALAEPEPRPQVPLLLFSLSFSFFPFLFLLFFFSSYLLLLLLLQSPSRGPRFLFFSSFASSFFLSSSS
jgi:hypothetical protein